MNITRLGLIVIIGNSFLFGCIAGVLIQFYWPGPALVRCIPMQRRALASEVKE